MRMKLMSRQELRSRIEPIVQDSSLNYQQRQAKLLPIMKQLFETSTTFDELHSLWTSTMSEVVRGCTKHIVVWSQMLAGMILALDIFFLIS